MWTRWKKRCAGGAKSESHGRSHQLGRGRCTQIQGLEVDLTDTLSDAWGVEGCSRAFRGHVSCGYDGKRDRDQAQGLGRTGGHVASGRDTLSQIW